MVAGGGIGVASNVAQIAGGLAQAAGGATSVGLRNAGYGTITLVGSFTLAGLINMAATRGANAAQRLFNSNLQAAAAVAGATYDATAYTGLACMANYYLNLGFFGRFGKEIYALSVVFLVICLAFFWRPRNDLKQTKHENRGQS